MPVPHVIPKVLLADPAANRFADALLAVLNPILRNVAGDLRGPVSAPTVVALQGRTLLDVAPADGQAIVWSAAAQAYLPGAVGGGTVTAVTATAPLASSGGATPNLSITGTPAGGVAYATGTTLAYTTAGTAGQALVSGGAGAPTWATLVASVAATAPLSSTGGASPTLSITGSPAGAVAYATGTTLAYSLTGTAGQFLVSGGAGAPTWETATASTAGAGVGGYRATTTTPDTVALTDYLVDVTTTGNFTVNLPTAGAGPTQAPNGRVFAVKNSGGATVTVAAQGGQTIDTATSFTIVTQWAVFQFMSTGSGWVVL